uniref:Cell division ATP-binding protein FtsE n=2 Tax=unclassified Candidatus Kentrum TaxID=2643149 RepID=A0A451B0I7_9GAMM|nr:MAG: cell division transport system ATP-binding protein [Candidatus Kentron sp. LPFa]VFK33244.1 MAG: cell division transport system ATP-binding protein [Candidatus Kentron sp. LPFa]VFK66186.1 MAG: cell division transport system ATP-binding protein [Candidatus Kentron sp. UNK]VFK71795.1 MAG: cell division transport system ATP-binding protein [Candidatus Kentron sp. UNK]
MIAFRHVFKRYPQGFDALRNITLEIPIGEMAFLTGHSGAGKSTLLRLIAVIERCTRGEIIVDGEDLSRISRRRIPRFRRKIGVVFQSHRLLMDRTVFDNVALPLVIAGHTHRDIARRVHAALDKVGLLRKRNSYPITLSGGEQQRVGIARGVVNKPPILLADEPTGNLDPALSREIMQLFRQFNRFGVTVLIATHDIMLIRQMKCRTLILQNGSLVSSHHIER